jgi:hypothetical protein
MRFITTTLAVLVTTGLAFAPAWGQSGSAGSAGSSAVSAEQIRPPEPNPTPAPPAASASDPGGPVDPVARKACTDAMNADPRFADAIIRTAEMKIAPDKIQREQLVKDGHTIGTHEAHNAWVAKNQRHVIMAYAAMWVIAAGFVLFLWRRQQRLVGEIQQLRKDLDGATKDDK